MYTPRSFQVDDKETLHALMRDFNFGLVFSQGEKGAVATHLPFMIDTERGKFGTLIAHLARANPHWKSWNEETELLVVFQGPHSYISPAWYKMQDTVPTWNYAAVHVYGRPRLIHDSEQLRTIVEDLVNFQEDQIGNPWDSTKMESEVETLLKAIVGFEIPIGQMEGKFKFNQNRSREDQESVAQALSESNNSTYRGVAEIMKKNLNGN